MIDLDKFICDFLSFKLSKEQKNQIPFSGSYYQANAAIKCIRFSIDNALKEQGLEYKEGAIKPIESMPEFKEGDVLYNKDSYASDSIFIFKGMSKTNTYLCYARLYGDKDLYVYSKKDWDKGVGIYGGEFYPANHKQKELLFSNMEKEGYKWNPNTLTLEKLEKPKQKFKVGDRIRMKNTSFLFQEIVSIKNNAYYFSGGLYLTFEDQDEWESEKPSTIKFDEPDIEEMVEDFKRGIVLSHNLKNEDLYIRTIAYRKGLEDMYKRLKDKV